MHVLYRIKCSAEFKCAVKYTHFIVLYSLRKIFFVESTKIWLVQKFFLFKYGSMEILFELTNQILLIFFAIPTKFFCIVKKKMELQIKITELL